MSNTYWEDAIRKYKAELRAYKFDTYRWKYQEKPREIMTYKELVAAGYLDEAKRKKGKRRSRRKVK